MVKGQAFSAPLSEADARWPATRRDAWNV